MPFKVKESEVTHHDNGWIEIHVDQEPKIEYLPFIHDMESHGIYIAGSREEWRNLKKICEHALSQFEVKP